MIQPMRAQFGRTSTNESGALCLGSTGPAAGAGAQSLTDGGDGILQAVLVGQQSFYQAGQSLHLSQAALSLLCLLCQREGQLGDVSLSHLQAQSSINDGGLNCGDLSQDLNPEDGGQQCLHLSLIHI